MDLKEVEAEMVGGDPLAEEEDKEVGDQLEAEDKEGKPVASQCNIKATDSSSCCRKVKM